MTAQKPATNLPPKPRGRPVTTGAPGGERGTNIGIRVATPEIRTAFLERCAAEGYTPSSLLGLFIEAFIDDRLRIEEPPPDQPPKRPRWMLPPGALST